MKNPLLVLALFVVVVVVVVVLSSCIDQIEFKHQQEETILVVDGVFSNLEELQVIKLSGSINLNSQIPNPITGADIFVEDQDGNRIAFPEQEKGTYAVEARAVPGNQYRLVGFLPSGRKFSSNLQSVPESFPIDDIRLVDTMVTFTDESGDKRRLHTLDFYAKGTTNKVENESFLRFSAQTVYQVSEIVCSPFVTPKTCYFYNDIPPLEVDLLKVDPSETAVQYDKLVYRRPLDYRVGEVFALDLRLYAYNKSEYDYWEKLKLIFDQNGNITDTTPARLTGNVIADDGTEIQGQFAVVGKTRKIEIVRNPDFPTQQLPFCGTPGLRPYPLPNACCGCHNLGGASLLRPDYWP